jgi:hypothetical protein
MENNVSFVDSFLLFLGSSGEYTYFCGDIFILLTN